MADSANDFEFDLINRDRAIGQRIYNENSHKPIRLQRIIYDVHEKVLVAHNKWRRDLDEDGHQRDDNDTMPALGVDPKLLVQAIDTVTELVPGLIQYLKTPSFKLKT